MEYLDKWREQKKKLKITNYEIAEKAGIPLRTVEQIMAGKVKAPRLDTVNAIESVLNPKELFSIPILDFYVDDDGKIQSREEPYGIVIDKNFYTSNVRAFSSDNSSDMKQLLNDKEMFAYRVSDDSMKPWYFKNDIVVCVHTDRLMPQRDYVVMYDDDRAKLRHLLIEEGKQGVDFIYYGSSLQTKTINKIVTHMDNTEGCILLGMAVQIIRDTMTDSFLLKR